MAFMEGVNNEALEDENDSGRIIPGESVRVELPQHTS